MKLINLDDETCSHENYKHDCKKIQEILLKKGYLTTLDQCYELWDKFSDSMAAGWMNVPENDEEIWLSISSYID